MTDPHGFELNLGDIRSLETLYRQAVREHRDNAFAAEITRRYTASPDDPLLAAWFFRLQGEPHADTVAPSRPIPWRLAVPFSLVLSLLYWLLAPDMASRVTTVPEFLILWAPVTACLLIVYLALAARSPTGSNAAGEVGEPTRSHRTRAALLVLVLVALTAFSVALGPPGRETYRTLLVLHLPLLATLAVGLFMTRPFDDQNGFAALLKGAEVLLTAGVLAGAALAFVVITTGLFSALSITLSQPLQRWLFFGVPGLTPVLAFALTYDPALPPLRQQLDQGFAKLLFTAARLLLPMALLVGVLYLVSIPANFFKPFQQREVLIIYNVMLFGVLALLCFATPLHESDIPVAWRRALRWAVVGVATLAVIVSLYALAATVYRTTAGGLTANRLTVLGWNALNIGLLGWFLIRQARGDWVAAIQRVFRGGMVGYAVWSTLIVLLVPFLFP